MKKRFEKETGKFIKVSTYNMEGSFEGYATVGDETVTYGRKRFVKGNTQDFSVYGQTSTQSAKIAVVERAAAYYKVRYCKHIN